MGLIGRDGIETINFARRGNYSKSGARLEFRLEVDETWTGERTRGKRSSSKPGAAAECGSGDEEHACAACSMEAGSSGNLARYARRA